MDDRTDVEYTLTRVDLGGRKTIVVRQRQPCEPYEVLADHSMPAWEIDAHVRAALIRELVERAQEPEDPAATA